MCFVHILSFGGSMPKSANNFRLRKRETRFLGHKISGLVILQTYAEKRMALHSDAAVEARSIHNKKVHSGTPTVHCTKCWILGA